MSSDGHAQYFDVLQPGHADGRHQLRGPFAVLDGPQHRRRRVPPAVHFRVVRLQRVHVVPQRMRLQLQHFRRAGVRYFRVAHGCCTIRNHVNVMIIAPRLALGGGGGDRRDERGRSGAWSTSSIHILSYSIRVPDNRPSWAPVELSIGDVKILCYWWPRKKMRTQHKKRQIVIGRLNWFCVTFVTEY